MVQTTKFQSDFNKHGGKNGLNAFEACVECGACSEEKFLESNELGAGGLAFILIMGILVGCAFLNFVHDKCCEG